MPNGRITGAGIVDLFNPRIHNWNAHFQAVDGDIIALTIGQATLKILRFNQVDLVMLRQLLMQAGRYP